MAEYVYAPDGDWCVMLVVGRNVPGGTETEEMYGYWLGRPTPKEYRERLIPEGWRQIGKAQVLPCKRG